MAKVNLGDTMNIKNNLLEKRNNPIGVCDSGVGGISTLGILKSILPNEDFIYFGDTLNAPYGTKTSSEVLNCVRNVVKKLLNKNIKALVIACNTATGSSLSIFKKELNIPVIGVEPALETAAKFHKKGKILVLATPLTLKQNNFHKLMEHYGDGVVSVPCNGLMELVEQENWDAAKKYLKEIFSKYKSNQIEAVVLGCTHYLFLKEIIGSILPKHTAIVFSDENASKELKNKLEELNLMSKKVGSKIEFFSSDNKKETIEKFKRFYQRSISLNFRND